MIKDFFGIPYYRIGESTRMWFTIVDIARRLGISLEDVAKFQKNRIFETIRIKDYKDQLSHIPEAAMASSSKAGEYTLDLILGLLYTVENERSIEMRDWIIHTINNLCYDGFVSASNWHLDLNYRRAIACKVCDEENYLGVVYSRYARAKRSRGTLLSPSEVNVTTLSNPDHYLTRQEIGRIKALDLGIHLILQFTGSESEEQTLALLSMVGVDVEKGVVTQDQHKKLLTWIRKNESDFL